MDLKFCREVGPTQIFLTLVVPLKARLHDGFHIEVRTDRTWSQLFIYEYIIDAIDTTTIPN